MKRWGGGRRKSQGGTKKRGEARNSAGFGTRLEFTEQLPPCGNGVLDRFMGVSQVKKGKS